MNPFKTLYRLLLLVIPGTSFCQEQNDSCVVTVPKTITMNCAGGGHLDYKFRVTANCKIIDFKIKVYNRWGDKLFESKDINEYWDASERKIETYVWEIKGHFENGEKIDKKGNVNLIK